MHEKRARSNTPTTTSSTRTEDVAATNPLAVGEGSSSGSSSTTTTAGGLGGYLVMASPSTSPPSHHESEALARLKRANLTLRERKNEERMRSGATSSDLPAFAPAHLHLSPRRPSAAAAPDTTELVTRGRASSTERKEKKEKEKSTRKWKKTRGVEPAQHKKAPVEEWRPKEVAKWLQAIELGDYAKAARKKKVDGAQLVLVVDTILSTSPAADHHADGGVVLAALGVKKLGHLKRLQRELRQAMLDSNGGDEGGENEDGDDNGDDNGDDGAEECEEERRKHKAAAEAAGKLPIPRGHSAPITVSAPQSAASSPNRLRRFVHNLSGSSTTPSSLSSSPSATSSSPSSSSSSLSAPSSVSFPAIDSDSDSFLTPAGDGAASHGRPRTRSKLIERLAIGMPRSRSAESPLPLASTSTSTSTSLSPLSGSTSLGRSGSGFGFGGNCAGGTGSCPLPAVVSPPLSPSGKRPSNSANFIAVAHGTSTLFDGDDESLGSTISTISTSSTSSSSSSSANSNLGATFSFSFPSSSSSHSASSISATWDASPSSCTSLAFCSMFGEVAIKCVLDDDISLVRLNIETDFSLSGLHRAIERVYGQRMRAHYFDSEGDKIRITTDGSLRYAYEDWCQALGRSGATISWRLHLKPRGKARAHSDASSSGPSSLSISASASPSMSMDVVDDYVADEAAAM